MSAHHSESQHNMLALRDVQYPQRSVDQRRRPNRRRRARVRLPVWQAAILMVLIATVTLLLFVQTVLSWVGLARSVYRVFQVYQSGLGEMVSAETIQLGESVRYTDIQLTPVQDVIEPIAQIQGVSYAWPEYITQWNSEIAKIADARQLDPDLIASIVEHESTGNYYAVSYAGAVGLMGVMPYGPGFFDRPIADRLVDPAFNLEVGTGIFLDFLRLTEYDLHYAIAAYNGGLGYANSDIPQLYAEDVLEQYARIVATRADVDPKAAFDWSLGYEVWRDGVATYYNQSPTNAAQIGRHTLFSETDSDGKLVEIIGYALPIGTLSEELP